MGGRFSQEDEWPPKVLAVYLLVSDDQFRARLTGNRFSIYLE
jgi:hypothetical protein